MAKIEKIKKLPQVGAQTCIKTRCIHTQHLFMNPLATNHTVANTTLYTMSFSLSLLLTTQECDDVLTQIGKDRSDVEYKQTSISRRVATAGERSVQVVADLAAVNTEISSLQSVVAGLADGPVKDDLESKVVRLQYRKFLLEERSESYGTYALLELEVDLARVTSELAEIDSFIADVNAHKATL